MEQHTVTLLTGRMMPTTSAHCSCGWASAAFTFRDAADAAEYGMAGENAKDVALAHTEAPMTFVRKVGSITDL